MVIPDPLTGSALQKDPTFLGLYNAGFMREKYWILLRSTTGNRMVWLRTLVVQVVTKAWLGELRKGPVDSVGVT